MQKGPTSRLIALSLTLALPACVGAPPIVTPNAVACSALIPEDWRQGVEAPQMPGGGSLSDVVGDWISFADAVVGKLDMANARTKDAIGIIERCEKRDAVAVRKASRGFFGRLFGG